MYYSLFMNTLSHCRNMYPKTLLNCTILLVSAVLNDARGSSSIATWDICVTLPSPIVTEYLCWGGTGEGNLI